MKLGLPWWLIGKESAHNAGDPGSIPGSGWSPGEGNDNPLQYSCLENPMDRGAWQATESHMNELLVLSLSFHETKAYPFLFTRWQSDLKSAHI